MSLRIAQVSASNAMGGAERIAMDLHAAHRAAGFDATLHVGDLTGNTPGVSRFSPDTIGAAADVLHLHNLHGGYFDIRLLRSLCQRLPTVVTLHDEWLYTAGPTYQTRSPTLVQRWRRWRRQRLLRHARLHLATPSRWIMDRAAAAMPGDAIAGRQVIANGVDPDAFHPPTNAERCSARSRLGLERNAPVVLFVAHNAHQHPFKDLSTVLAAIRLLQHPAHLLVAGTPGDTQPLGHSDVRYLSHLDDAKMLDAYHAADLCLHAAAADNFPNVVLEAMACGLPVIATDVGGIGEQVVENQTGRLVAARDSAAMARHASRLLADPAERQRLGQAAVQQVTQHFTLARQAAAYRMFYEAAIQHHTTPPPPST